MTVRCASLRIPQLAVQAIELSIEHNQTYERSNGNKVIVSLTIPISPGFRPSSFGTGTTPCILEKVNDTAVLGDSLIQVLRPI